MKRPSQRATRITLNQAHAVIEAHRVADAAKREVELQKFVGRFFRHRNCYSLPQSDADYWWLYLAVVKVEESSVMGWTFSRDKDGKIEVDPSTRLHMVGEGTGWTEIPPRAFWDAAAKLREEASRLLSDGVLVEIPQ